jgi:hypothetical protein
MKILKPTSVSPPKPYRPPEKYSDLRNAVRALPYGMWLPIEITEQKEYVRIWRVCRSLVGREGIIRSLRSASGRTIYVKKHKQEAQEGSKWQEDQTIRE